MSKPISHVIVEWYKSLPVDTRLKLLLMPSLIGGGFWLALNVFNRWPINFAVILITIMLVVIAFTREISSWVQRQ